MQNLHNILRQIGNSGTGNRIIKIFMKTSEDLQNLQVFFITH